MYVTDRLLIFVTEWLHDYRNLMVKERDRELSEEKLIGAIGELIEEVGFEKVGINQVAKRAGFSKNLIYRYFDSLDGLIYAYMKKNDFWAKGVGEEPDFSDIKSYMKSFYRRQIAEFRDDVALKRLRRWELSTNKDIVVQIRMQREKNGVQFTDMVAGFANVSKEQLQAISALIDAGLTYLAMFEENCVMYNGINIQTDEGWRQIADGIDALLDLIIK